MVVKCSAALCCCAVQCGMSSLLKPKLAINHGFRNCCAMFVSGKNVFLKIAEEVWPYEQTHAQA